MQFHPQCLVRGPRAAALLIVLALTAGIASACSATAGDAELASRSVSSRNPLGAVESWAYQLQGLERAGAVQRLERAAVDLVVVEPTNTVVGAERFPTGRMVDRIHARSGPAGRTRLALAYLNVGQAEDYRAYWRASWRPPTHSGRGTPDFILTLDPDGWPGNYPVAFWDPRWKAVLYGSPGALVDRAIADGFDGVYLDWVLGYGEPLVVEAAREAGVEPARAMAELIRDLRAYARTQREGFLVVPQNAAPLVHEVPELAGWIDGVAQEDLSFRGEAVDEWNDARGGDIPVSRGESLELARQLKHCLERGVPVFTVDYALDPGNARRAVERSRKHGFVPSVSRTSLARIPDELVGAR